MTKRITLELKKRDVRLKDIPLFYKGLVENKMSIGVHKREGISVGDGILPNKANNLEKAYWNEFGTRHVVKRDFKKWARGLGKYINIKAGTIIIIPPRPFVRLYLYNNKIKKISQSYNYEISNAFRDGLKQPKTSADKVLKNVSFLVEKEMQETIRGNSTLKPNANFTIDVKGFDYPLFETGKLLNAIKGKVEKR